MHPLAQVTVRRIADQHPRFDWYAAFDRIQTLDTLARQIEAPPPAEAAALLDAPVMLGGVAFYRFSAAALELSSTVFSDWDGRLFDLGIAWASAHARDPAAVRALMAADDRRARRTVLDWARGLSCSYDAVVAVLRSFSPKSDAETAKDDGADFGSVISALMQAYGQTAEYWTFCPIDEIKQRLADLATKAERERKAMAKEAKVAMAPEPDSWGFRAQVRFNKAARELERWAAQEFGDEQ